MSFPFLESDISTSETSTTKSSGPRQTLQLESNNNFSDHVVKFDNIIALNQTQAERIREQQEEIRHLKEETATWETIHTIQVNKLMKLQRENRGNKDHIKELRNNATRRQDAYEKAEHKHRNTKRQRDSAVHAREWAIEQRDEAWDERDDARLLRDQAWMMRDRAWQELEEFKNAVTENGGGGNRESQKR